MSWACEMLMLSWHWLGVVHRRVLALKTSTEFKVPEWLRPPTTMMFSLSTNAQLWNSRPCFILVPLTLIISILLFLFKTSLITWSENLCSLVLGGTFWLEMLFHGKLVLLCSDFKLAVPGLFSFISVFFKWTSQFLHQHYVKNVHPVSIAGIQTLNQ